MHVTLDIHAATISELPLHATLHMSKIQLGELAAGRQVLEGADLAPGNPDTLQHLRARPQVPRDPILVDQGHIPPAPFELDRD